jgi:small subunit ribosomal protein S20
MQEAHLANKRSALKAHRVSERRHERNRAVKSALRTFVKKARTEIEGVTEEAAAIVGVAAQQLDAAASKGIIHRNQAARRKSRLMHQLAQATAQGADAAGTEKAAPAKGRARTAAAKSGTTRGKSAGAKTGSTARTTRSTTSRTRTTK